MIRDHHIETSKTARYYTIEPNGEPAGVLFVIHGYRQLAKYFIKHFQHLAHVGLMIVAPEGLHRFYIEGYDGRVGSSWMTKEDREVDINDYINYLNKLHKTLAFRESLPIDILGFSQGGPTACRWLASCDFEVRNLILHSTVFPNDFDFKGNMNRLSQADVYSVFGDHDSMRGRLKVSEGLVHLGGISEYEQKLINANRIIIVACGTSWHAGLVGEYLIEDLARIPVEVEYASEFRYRNPIISEKDVLIAISQSGETADTLAALELAKSKGATILGICNVVGSTISRVTHGGSYTHAGPEIGVASTKAFTSQVTVLSLLALMLGQRKGTIERSRYQRLLHGLNEIPQKVERALQTNTLTEVIASKFRDSRNFLYLGRGYCFPVALEGALKLKEISYIHAEGYPAAEMKHGPIALIDEEMPVVVIATKGPSYEKVVSNIQEVKARKGVIIAIVTEGDVTVKEMADYTIEIPEIDEIFTPLVASIPLQLLSYHIAVMRGCNVDQPRNLAKSVTVE